MAIVSSGYDGTLDEVAWAQMVPAVGSSDYGVVDFGDWLVTTAAGDRTISIAPGSGWGKGVFDTSDTVVSIQLPTISSGSRWDMIVMNRDWSGAGGVSDFKSITGSASKSLPARNTNPGTLDDQPLALVQVTAGKTAPTGIIDLRCWGGNGGMTAADPLALQYLNRPGGQLTIGTTIYANTGITPGSTPAWRQIASMGNIDVFGVGASQWGNPAAPASGQGFLVQAGLANPKTDANGFAKIVWPVPFPNGCLTAFVQNADNSLWGAMNLDVATAWGSSPINRYYGVWWPTQVTSDMVNRNYPNKTIRLNYFAIGW